MRMLRGFCMWISSFVLNVTSATLQMIYSTNKSEWKCRGLLIFNVGKFVHRLLIDVDSHFDDLAVGKILGR